MTQGAAEVAVVGTGRMGAAMGGRLAAVGHRVTVWNRSRDRAEALAADRANLTVAATAREAAAAADVVVVSLADDAAVRDVHTGPDGLVAGLRRGALVADCSTLDRQTVLDLAPAVERAGATLLDTPVSGSVASVESGQLLVMAGGDPAAVAAVTPVLAAFAKRVVPLGPLGAGMTMKLAVNTMVFGLNQTLAEALVLAEAAGVARHDAYEVIADSAVAAPFVVYKRQAHEDPDGTPVAFALGLAAKDLDLAAALARQVGARMPQAATNRRVVQEALDAGLGDADLSALAGLLRGEAGPT